VPFVITSVLCYPATNARINVSTVLAGQRVGIKALDEGIWIVSFMQYDLGFFDHETARLESAENPFAAKVLPMCPEWTLKRW